VHAAFALREAGFETLMVNCNPETVSTDYDTSDRLYFEPLTLEDVLEVVHREKPMGLIVQFGGQTPLKLARALEAAGVPILGTTPDSIDRAEDRERFSALVEKLKLRQAENGIAHTPDVAFEVAERIGYPVMVRPSYVLGGRAMEVVYDESDLARYLKEHLGWQKGGAAPPPEAANIGLPLLVDRFLQDATEVDLDLVADSTGASIVGGVLEHVEEAGVHSGDAACCMPPHSLPPVTIERMKDIAQGGRPDERAVRHPGEDHLGARGEPPRVAHHPLRVQGHRHPAGARRQPLHGGQDAQGAGHHRGSRAQALLGERERVPLRALLEHRRHPRAGDEVHR
jgi:carbamoyl-phosphate synthase large subunit